MRKDNQTGVVALNEGFCFAGWSKVAVLLSTLSLSVTVTLAQEVDQRLEGNHQTVQSVLSESVQQEKPVIGTAINNFIDTIVSRDKETETVSVVNVVTGSTSEGATLSSTVFIYNGEKLGNPFVPTGALAAELGLLDESENNEQEKNQSEQVSSVIVGGDIEETEVVVNNPRDLEPLEYFAKESLVYTGHITNKYGKSVALINGPDGLLYKAGVGDRLGYSQAQVAGIRDQAVVIRVGSIEDVIPLTAVKQ